MKNTNSPQSLLPVGKRRYLCRPCEIYSPSSLDCSHSGCFVFLCREKKLVYLQDKEAKGSERYEKDVNLPSITDTYLLRPGDILFVNMQKFVVGEELFSISGFEQANRIGQMQHPFLQGHNVDGEGNIDLPLLGKVKAEGRSIDQLQTELKGAAMKEYPGAVVELFLLDGMVSVLGEVNNAGRYPIYKSKNTIFDLIASAGDLGDYANRSSIKILREKDLSLNSK